MKRVSLIFAALAALSTISCTRNVQGGGLRFAVEGLEDAFVSQVTKSEQRVLPSEWIPAENEFSLEIRDSRGSLMWSGLLPEWTSSDILPVGDYTAKLHYGSVSDEGLDKPCFEGAADFTIVSDETVTVTVTVALANCIVDVTFGENFKKYFTDYDFTVTSGTGNTFGFDGNDDREVFIEAWKLTLSGTVKNQAGAESAFKELELTDLKPRTYYTIDVDVTNIGGVGTLQIYFNDTLETVELGEIELN